MTWEITYIDGTKLLDIKKYAQDEIKEWEYTLGLIDKRLDKKLSKKDRTIFFKHKMWAINEIKEWQKFLKDIDKKLNDKERKSRDK